MKRVVSSTKIFGILGYPLKHSLSPSVFNSFFLKEGLKNIYLPFEVQPSRLKSFVETAKNLGISGFNVTAPYKEAIIQYLDGFSSSARIISAVNAVVLEKDKFIGYNTDAQGFLNALKETECPFPPKRAIILGAGGVAKACIYALLKAGCFNIEVFNRTPKRAKKLAEHFHGYFPKAHISTNSCFSKNLIESVKRAELLINATTKGLPKNQKIPSVWCNALHSSLFVFDLIYNPPKTELIKYAERKGAKACNGLKMFIEQAALSFSLFNLSITT